MNNSCLFNVNGGSITVRISANNGIRTSSLFYLGKPNENNDYDIIEKHKSKTGDSGDTSFSLSQSPSNIQNFALAWSLNACTIIPAVENGKVKIEFWQDGNKCKTTTETTYYGNYPQCSDGKHRAIKKQIIFVQLPQIQKTQLWQQIG